MTLDEDGNATFTTDLPLGSYYVKEIETDVHYILEDTVYAIDFEYAGQDVESVDISVNDGEVITNELIYGNLYGKKIDENGDPLEGALFGIFAFDDEEFTEENALMTVSSKEDGSFYFDNIPYGTWYLREIAAPDGYVYDDIVYEITISEDGQIIETEIADDITTVEITKTDLTTGEELPGAEMQVIDKDGNIIDEWTSTTEPHVIQKLTVGETYTLVETKPADGYATAESISFTIENTSDIQEVVMEDDVTKVEISKTDITNGEEIPGAELVVTDDDGNVIDEWISTDEPHVITGLTVDETYTLTETCPADGYVTAEDIEFIISDTGEIQTVEMKDDVTKVEISKVDSEGNYVAGAELQILDSEGEVIAEFTSSDEAYYIEKLIAGAIYTLHEVSAPDGYELSDDVEFTVEDTADVQYVSMVDEETLTTETTETTTDTPTTTTTTTESTPNTGSDDNGLVVLFALAGLFAVGFVGMKARAFKKR